MTGALCPLFYNMLIRLCSEIHLEKILLIIIACVLLIIIHVPHQNIGETIAKQNEQVTWIFLGTIVFIGTLKALIQRKFIEYSLKPYILAFVSLRLISVLFNPIKNMDSFSINCAHLLGGVLLWMALLQFELSQKKRLAIFLLIFVSCVIDSIIRAIQFFGLYRYIPLTPLLEAGTFGGIFQQEGSFASWIATGIIISLYLISTGWIKNFSKVKKSLLFSGVFLLSMSLITAESNIGIISLTIGMVLILTSRCRHYLVARKTTLIWFAIFITGASAGFFLLSIKDRLEIKKPTVRKLQWFPTPEDVSYKERILMYETAFEMFREKPITGQGFSNFGSLYMYYQAKVKKSNPDYYRGIGNTYIYNPISCGAFPIIIAENGIMGTMGLLVVLYGILKFYRRIGKRFYVYIALLTPFLIHIMFDCPLKLSVAHWFSFILIGAISTSHFLKKTGFGVSKRLTIGLIVTASCFYILFVAFVAKTLIAYNQLIKFNIKYAEGENVNFDSIILSTENLYLRNWAKPIYMFAKAEKAIKDIEHNKDFLFEFLEWSQTEKQRNPRHQVFLHDALVLLNLGIHFERLEYFDEAMKTVEQGLFLYSESKELQELRNKIVGEALKMIIKNVDRKG